ncbi:BQ2448_2709 [Microbotryum intermedium]|uniref:2'-phosphotransferase n=1 Tax=Microbotryum intermedium TaxID=269621 RepID=A0A238FG67_9BASI|nr:BQ2448_2709 [Microbotryum intermedium]
MTEPTPTPTSQPSLETVASTSTCTSTSASASPPRTKPSKPKPKTARTSTTSSTVAPTARGRATDSDDVRHSKTLSYILRHGAAKEHLVLRADGFVRVDDLLKRPKLKGVTFATLQRIVAENEKQRFMLQKEPKSGGAAPTTEEEEFEWWIRANQGHSVQVDSLELKSIQNADQVPVMVHGTTYKLWPTIAQQGLSKMSRNHIHCATGLFGEAGVKSGMRAKCDLFIYLDVPKLIADNIPIYASSNNVLLTSGKEGIVAPRYFKKVERKIVGSDNGVEQLDLSKLSLQ